MKHLLIALIINSITLGLVGCANVPDHNNMHQADRRHHSHDQDLFEPSAQQESIVYVDGAGSFSQSHY